MTKIGLKLENLVVCNIFNFTNWYPPLIVDLYLISSHLIVFMDSCNERSKCTLAENSNVIDNPDKCEIICFQNLNEESPWKIECIIK